MSQPMIETAADLNEEVDYDALREPYETTTRRYADLLQNVY